MSRIRKEITACLLSLAERDGKLSGIFSFPASFAGFQGHFEKSPVLPGICKIQSVLAMYEKHLGGTFRLKEVSQAKYFAPVLPDQQITVLCESRPAEKNLFQVKALIQKENAKAAQLQMVVEHVQS